MRSVSRGLTKADRRHGHSNGNRLARLTYTDVPYPTLLQGGARPGAPLGTQPSTFAPESSQILAISSPGIVPRRDLPPAATAVGGKRCPFECAIPLPMPVYRPENITGLGFKGNLGTVVGTRSFLRNTPRCCTVRQ